MGSIVQICDRNVLIRNFQFWWHKHACINCSFQPW